MSANVARQPAPPLAGVRRRRLMVFAAWVVYTLLVLLLQRIQGAPGAAFGGYPDEPAHYVSGLLVHDYALSGSLTAPKAYAIDYYVHNPYFAIGHWPPLFYVVEALWMAVFGVSRGAVLVLIAAVAAGSAALLFSCLQSEFGRAAAFAAGLMFLLSPVVVWSSGLVMTDLAVTLLSFAAALAFARYLDTARPGAVYLFAGCAAAALLTKGSAGFLILVPPLAVLVSGRWEVFKRPSLWIAGAAVAAACGPWYLLTRVLGNRGYESPRPFLAAYASHFALGFSANLLWLVPLFLLGAWLALRGLRPMPGLSAVCLVQPLAVCLFLIVIGQEVEDRYLTPGLPPLIVLAMAGLGGIAGRAAPAHRSWVIAAAALLMAAPLLPLSLRRVQPVPPDPLRPLADFVIQQGYRSVLVPADAEGPMIAEIDQREPDRMARYLVRPNKLLARTDWTGITYQALYAGTNQMQVLFDRLPLDVILVRMNPPADAPLHELLLRDMVLEYSGRWRLVRSFDGSPPGPRYSAYAPVKRDSVRQEDLPHFLTELLRAASRF